MYRVRPLPNYLVQRYHGWKATGYADNKSFYKRLATEGQHPRAMVIACCDSRVNVIPMFGADQGELFIHRNIANLVPPYAPDGDHHGTSAAVEYAVRVLKVSNLIVMGHSHCGGIKGCIDMCKGKAPDLEAKGSFVGRWMDILRPRYDRVADIADEDAQQHAMEKQAIVTSLENLMTFPWIEEAVSAGTLTLHGLWNDIGEGELEHYNPQTDSFHPV
ncbi:carbonic anhydrase [Marimonas sp. MJW-29]|uniref:Carbonic anhydrase n=1 Tax=Sulfitobacter sediminis TaxID=3234186 RepID=A0ABV3RLY7_9RHOB